MFRESDYDDALWVYDDLSEQIEKLKKSPDDNSKEIEKLEKEKLEAFDRMNKISVLEMHLVNTNATNPGW